MLNQIWAAFHTHGRFWTDGSHLEGGMITYLRKIIFDDLSITSFPDRLQGVDVLSR